MKRRWLAAAAAVVLLLSGCGPGAEERERSALLGIDLSAAEETAGTDSRGGFHGDGTAAAVYRFPDGADPLSQIEEAEGWLPLPMEGAAAIYGGEAAGAKASTTLQSPLADAQGWLPGSCGAQLQALYQREDGASFARVYFWNGTEQTAAVSSLSRFVITDGAGEQLADLSGCAAELTLAPQSGGFLEVPLPEGFSLPQSAECELEPVYTLGEEGA